MRIAVEFEIFPERKELQMKLDQLELKKARKIDIRIQNEGYSDENVNLIERDLDLSRSNLHNQES